MKKIAVALVVFALLYTGLAWYAAFAALLWIAFVLFMAYVALQFIRTLFGIF